MDSNFAVDHTQYATGMLGSMLTTIWLVAMIFSIIIIVANWKMFKKAGEPGVVAIVPFWNTAVLFRMTWGKWYFMFFMFIPFVNFVIGIITLFKLAKVFGKGIGFGFGLLFLSPIFMLILGFGSAQYVGIDDQYIPVDKPEASVKEDVVSESAETDIPESLPVETEYTEPVSHKNSSGRSWSV